MNGNAFTKFFSFGLYLLIVTSNNDNAWGQVGSSSTPDLPSPIMMNSSINSSPAPNLPVTANVCNMSLITSTPEAIQKKCVCNSRDMDVDCSHLAIKELPDLISFPKGVHIVSFQGNEIANINIHTFYNGRNIIELDLSYNRIDFISSSAFKAFKSLKRLDLSHNRLWNLPLKVFEGLGALSRLDLSFNDIITVFPETFSTLSELRELSLESNPLQELEPKQFEHMGVLETLDLESTLLKYLPDHIFVFTPKLKVLKLANNQLTNVPTEALHVLPHLKVLDLSGNDLELIKAEAFRGMSGMVILYLDRMPSLTKIEKYAFGDLIQLEELHCSYNFFLSEIDEHAFVRKLDNRKISPAQIFLRQNILQSVPKTLVLWSDKIELHLRDNPLRCDCEVEWMVNTRLKNNFQDHVVCSSPSEFEGMTLTELKGHELSCGLHMSEVILIACSVVIALIIVTLIVAFLIWRRNYRGYSKPYVRGYKNKHTDEIEYRGGDDDL